MNIYIDMMGNEVRLAGLPRRIVSLVPSQTELLYDLGLDEEVVGITKFCVHPEEWFRNKKRVGGTKNVHLDIVKELQPDLIIANKEENTKEQIEELSKLYPVWVSDIRTISEGLQMIREVGKMVGKGQRAEQLAGQIVRGFEILANASAGESLKKPARMTRSDGETRLGHQASSKRVAYFIWRAPWMSVGGDTFISDVIQAMGWENVLKERARYPEVVLEELVSLNPELVLLSSEPYPFKDKHIEEIKAVLPDAEVMLVDGEMFSWYGSRMREAVGYLKNLTAKTQRR